MKVPQRGKAKYKVDISTSSVYRDYAKEHKSDGFFLEKKDYQRVCRRFIASIKDNVIKENLIWSMPCNSGRLTILKEKGYTSKVKYYPIDWKSSRQLGKIIRYLNKHTFGYICKIKWMHGGCNYDNRGWYSFKPARKFQRELATIIKNPDLEVDFFVKNT